MNNRLSDLRLRGSRPLTTRRTLLGATAAFASWLALPARFSKALQQSPEPDGDIPAGFLTSGEERWHGALYDNRRAFEKVVTLKFEHGHISPATNPVPVAELQMECPSFQSWRHSTLRLAWVNPEASMIGLHEISSESSRCQGIGDSCCYPQKLVMTAQLVDDSTLRLASIEGPSMGWLTRQDITSSP
jgi:hypothetical protein